MCKPIAAFVAFVLIFGMPVAQAQSSAPASEPVTSAAENTAADTITLRAEIEQLKKTLAGLEARLTAQEKKETAQPDKKPADTDLKASLKQVDRRLERVERDNGLQRVRLSGEYRFQAHTVVGHIPDYFDGMKLQNLVVKTMFTMNTLGRPPGNIEEINRTVGGHFSDYQFFTQNLTFDQLKQAMGQFPPQMQQQLFGMLMPSTLVRQHNADNSILYTNRLRLNLDSRLSENVSVAARLSMYKTFGDSTGVQVFNGQPNTLNVDGTTTGVPNSDMLRVERAYFTWNKMGGSPFFLSIGRRPSTEGPPLNIREDEPRGGTPSGALINYQFDGLTFGYHLGDHTVLRLCYGLGYESGFGNGNLLKMPQDRLKDVHFLGGNFDLWNSEDSLVQVTVARAYDVTDGFNGLMVLPNNPVTGETVGAPVVMRFTPSSNLGAINLAGVNFTKKISPLDLFVSLNYVGLRPNGKTTPFGGLGSDPFEQPVNRDGGMIYVGARYNFANDERTKLGFEYNHGSKYWFNFAHAEDDIIAPKTNTRGDVFESFLTHRLNQRLVLKAGYIRYNYKYSGSGWHLGSPKKLDSTPLLGFPTYKNASMFTLGMSARF